MRLLFSLLAILFVGSLSGQSEASWNVMIKRSSTIEDLFSSLDLFESCVVNSTAISEDLNIYNITSRCLTIEDLWSSEVVLIAERNLELALRDKTPNDDLYGEQWQMEHILAPRVWDFTTGGVTAEGDEVVIAVLDEGFNTLHEDLVDNLYTNEGEIPGDSIDNDGNGYTDDYLGYNVKNENDVHDSPGTHATGVTGIVGAKGNNGIGVTGVNWDVKVLMLEPIRQNAWVEAAMSYVYKMRKAYNESQGQEGAYIVAANLSFGKTGVFQDEFPIMCALIDSMGSVGVLSVAAAPNSLINIDEVGDLPNDCKSDYLISVTNTDESDDIYEAGYGPINIDLGAPGEESRTTGRDSSYRTFGGASAAAPYVSGTIGLLYSAACNEFIALSKSNPGASALALREAILNGVTPSFALEGMSTTGGRLNLFMALEEFNNSSCQVDTNLTSRIDYIGLSDQSPNTTIRLTLKPLVEHKLEFFDVSGRLLKEMDLPAQLLTSKTVVLKGSDFLVPRATYVVRLTGGGAEQSEKFIVVY